MPSLITTAIKTRPFPYPPSGSNELADEQFGIIVEGIHDINNLTEHESKQCQDLLYRHSIVLFPGVDLTPAGQFKLTLAFDPACAGEYGHGKVGRPEAGSILHPDLRNIPSQPAVQLIGNGQITDERILQGLPSPTQLRHPSHETFHKDPLSAEDRARGLTRFYRWHIDAALYARDPPKVTTLYGLDMPQSVQQKVLYDDGTGDELDVPLGGTSFVSTSKMFDILPAPLKSLAVRCKVQYKPHPYVWMGSAKSRSTGLGMVSDGLEMSSDELPSWNESDVKVYPMVWRGPVTDRLHLQVHPSAVESLIIEPIPENTTRSTDAMYPDGVHLTDLEEVRDLLYSMQRPGIAPNLVITHDWSPKDLILFHNRGTLHTITGSFKPEQKRAFWQCNLASSDQPVGPTEQQIQMYA